MTGQRFGFNPLTTNSLDQMYMRAPRPPRPLSSLRTLLGLAGCALLVTACGLWLLRLSPGASAPVRVMDLAPGAVAPGAVAPPAVSALRPLTHRGVADPLTPTRVRMARIGVDAPLARLTLNRDSTIQTPADPRMAGWFAGGPVPGDPGPAVILGHVDSVVGPAVFWHLDELRPGDTVVVSRAGGDTVSFTVQRVARYPRSAFPSAAVYGATRQPELRLITCGGFFNPLTSQYSDNVVVFATMAAGA